MSFLFYFLLSLSLALSSSLPIVPIALDPPSHSMFFILSASSAECKIQMFNLPVDWQVAHTAVWLRTVMFELGLLATMGGPASAAADAAEAAAEAMRVMTELVLDIGIESSQPTDDQTTTQTGVCFCIRSCAGVCVSLG